MIADEDSATVVVRYAAHRDAIEKLLQDLAAAGPKRGLMRKLQRYTVSIQKRVADKMLMEGSLSLVPAMPGLYLQTDTGGLYDALLGLQVEEIPFNPSGNVL